jgi:hypothetical protein
MRRHRRPMLRAGNPRSTPRQAINTRRTTVSGRQYQLARRTVHAGPDHRAAAVGRPIVRPIKVAATGIEDGSPVVLLAQARAATAGGYQPGPPEERAAAKAAGSRVGPEARGVAVVIAGGNQVDQQERTVTAATVGGSPTVLPNRVAAITDRNQVVPDGAATATAAGNRVGPRARAAAIAHGSPIARLARAVAAAIGAGSQVGLQGDPLVDAAVGHQEAADGRVAEDRRDDLSRGSLQTQA